MKRWKYALASLLLCVALVAAVIPAYGATFYGAAELLEIKSHIEKDAGMSRYATVQGACTDGEYAYFAVQEYSTVILKYDMRTWKLKKKATVSGLGHANDMAYNTNQDVIVIANNNVGDDVLTLVDPDSLETIGTVQVTRKKTAKEIEKEKKENTYDKKDEKVLNVYSVAYQEAQNRYVVGLSGTYDFAVLDDKFKVVKQYKGEKTGYTRQGCDCDDNYIYFPQSDGDNLVVVYDYSGKHVDTFSLDNTHEVENLFHVGNDFYLTLHYYGNSVQRVGFSDDTQIRFGVHYSAAGGKGRMEPSSVHYGEDTKLKKCTFQKPGYFFGGWKVKRNYNDTYMGRRLGSTKNEWLEKKDVYDDVLLRDQTTVSKLTRIGDVTLSAFWISEAYEIRYDCGSGEGWMEPDTVAYADRFTVPHSLFTRHGYVFSGYTAQRDCDGRVYGYYGDAVQPRWLEPEDMTAPYLFSEGEEVSRLAFDGAVTFTAQFTIAFTFDDEQRTLLSYIGVDERVDIPNPTGGLRAIAGGAFSDNAVMKELIVPSTVEQVERGAVTRCSSLEDILFEERFPQRFDSGCIVDCKTQRIYLVLDGQPVMIGFYAGSRSADDIGRTAAAVEQGAGLWRAVQRDKAEIPPSVIR